MKLNSYYFLIVIFFWSCNDSVTKRNPNIFIGGFRQELRNGQYVSYAKYWKNGQPTDVTDGSMWVVVKCMTISGNDIYIGGHERPITGSQWWTRYWKNGTGTTINEERSFDVECIGVSSNDIFVGGGIKTSNGDNFWKNGVPVVLESSGTVNAITVYGNDVYVAGLSENARVAYWKNGTITEVSDVGIGPFMITSIAVSGNDVYVGGQISSPSPSSGYSGIETAVYWKNGEMINLGAGSVNSLAVNGSDVYAAGYGYKSVIIVGNTTNFVKVGRYWKNGTPIDIEQDVDLVGIAVDRDDVHLISGNSYWKNQIKLTLNSSDSTDFFRTIIVK